MVNVVRKLSNKPDAVNPAIASQFQSGHHWRGVTDLKRSASFARSFNYETKRHLQAGSPNSGPDFPLSRLVFFSDALHRDIWQRSKCVCDDSDVRLAVTRGLLVAEICAGDYTVCLSRIRDMINQSAAVPPPLCSFDAPGISNTGFAASSRFRRRSVIRALGNFPFLPKSFEEGILHACQLH
jgi:hypothetical protein